MQGFAVYYVESNLVCALVFTILLIHNHFNIDRQEKQIKFDHALLAFLLYFLADCYWALIVDDVIPKTRFNAVLCYFLVYVLMAAIIYFWLDYVLACEQVPHRNRPINRFAVLFPILHPVELAETDALIRAIREELALAERDTPFSLTISVGYDQLGGVQDSIQSCIRRADKKLYEDKEHKNSRPARAAG